MSLDLDALTKRAELRYRQAKLRKSRNDDPAMDAMRLEYATDVLALVEEVRRGNFFRFRLAERLSLAETAVVELECALSADPSYDPNHWRHHAESALDLCKRATVSRVPAGEAAE